MDSLTFFLTFNALILVFVVADFIVMSRNSSAKCAFVLTIFWIILGLAFSGVIFIEFGKDATYEYITAYFVEKSLSIDNMFVFYLIFSNFGIKQQYQHKLLFIGIWSALIFRTLIIFVIDKLISTFSCAIYIFGILILYMGVKSFYESDKSVQTAPFVNFIKKYVPLLNNPDENRLFAINNRKLYITHLLIAVMFLEICDVVFALDSIPALFSITTNKLIIYTSNAFAIIGLRSLYASFVKVLDNFYYLKYAVGVILCIVGLKMLLADYLHISPEIYLLLISCILAVAFLASKVRLNKKEM